MSNFFKCISLLLIVGVTGCQSYHPVPLDSGSVQRALKSPDEQALQLAAQKLHHPLLQPVPLDFNAGLSPDTAAVLAVLLNPSLRALRDERGLAQAQLQQAGLLPNPQLTYSLDQPAFGSTAGTVSAYGLGLSWDTQQLITRSARVQAAQRQRKAVDLNIAWQEWQVAESAKTAVYQLVVLEQQTALVTGMDQRLAKNLDLVRKAAKAGQITDLDLSAAETAASQAHANRLVLDKQTVQQRLELNRLLGLPPQSPIKLQTDILLPTQLEVPSALVLGAGLEQRRLDLVALQQGYASQEATVRAAILGQFPKLNLGVNRARDTGNVGTMGFGVGLELPVFDRSQGVIAQERATRQKLFDEYVNRVFEARAEIARLVAEAESLNEQIQTATAANASLERLEQAYRTALNSGQADVLSYYTAWNNVTQNRVAVLMLKEQLLQTRIALELASGRYRLDAGGTSPVPSFSPTKEIK